VHTIDREWKNKPPKTQTGDKTLRYIDLTVELADGMVRHPAPHLPAVEVVPVARHEVERRSVQRVTFGTHVSTHFDAPFHAIPGGQTIDEVPLDVCIGPAAMIRIKGVSKDQPIDEMHLKEFETQLQTNERVILVTQWSEETWGTSEYFTEGPYLTRAAAHYLVQFSLKLIGMDFPNIDSNEETKPGLPAPNHNIILGKGIVLLENLVRLNEITEDTFQLISLPLRLIGGDGCPGRAVAQVNS
jgi:arylformamidase